MLGTNQAVISQSATPLPPPSPAQFEIGVAGISIAVVSAVVSGTVGYLARFWADTTRQEIREAKDTAEKGYQANRQAIDACANQHLQDTLRLQERHSDEIQALRESQQRLEVDLAKNYVSRQDFLRQSLVHNAALDKIFDAIRVGSTK
jgi:hypothetical protein